MGIFSKRHISNTKDECLIWKRNMEVNIDLTSERVFCVCFLSVLCYDIHASSAAAVITIFQHSTSFSKASPSADIYETHYVPAISYVRLGKTSTRSRLHFHFPTHRWLESTKGQSVVCDDKSVKVFRVSLQRCGLKLHDSDMSHKWLLTWQNLKTTCNSRL